VIGIIIPLIQEASVFRIKKSETKRPIKISDNLLLFVSGVGIQNATYAVNELASEVSHIISWGSAAGLSENVKPGDLILPDLILDEKGKEYVTDSNFKNRMVQLFPKELSYYDGSLCESSAILKEAEEKREFGKKYNAIACDMESATIAKLAKLKGISFSALRVISDDYNTSIPKSVYLSINKEGDFSIRKFLFQLLVNPKEIIQVIRLGKNFSKAKKTMLKLKKVLLNL
jgi:adenosylhomocysteine nucleosidase